MTPELFENILKAKTLKEVEEIYKPYKSKKKTKAMYCRRSGHKKHDRQTGQKGWPRGVA